MAKLFIVPTPIGNLQDITLRAVEILKNVSVILSEDTRVTKKLLSGLKIDYKDKKILNYFEHNERDKLKDVLVILDGGYDVALVSDAGMPLINDPGFPLVRAIRELKKNVDIVVLPGASAVLCALAASGLPTDRFTFLGYVPRKPNDKKKMLKAVKRASENIKSTYIVFETKHRLESTLLMMKLILGGSTPLSVCKELTKVHEKVEYGTVQDAVDKISAINAGDLKGEYVLVFAVHTDSPFTP